MNMQFDKLTTSEVIDNIIEEVMETERARNKKNAKMMILNALMSNVVRDEIMAQIDWYNTTDF